MADRTQEDRERAEACPRCGKPASDWDAEGYDLCDDCDPTGATEISAIELQRKNKRLAARVSTLETALREAARDAEHLFAMLDRETWRAQGAEWMGQYEGDKWAEDQMEAIKRWAALAEGDNRRAVRRLSYPLGL